jgi:hypothetical protein
MQITKLLHYASFSVFLLLSALYDETYSQEIYKHKLKKVTYGVSGHIKLIYCHHSKARSQVADGGDGLQI